MRLLYIGNFGAQHSTENDVRKSLESMGHEVVTLQENTWDASPATLLSSGASVVLYTATHGWGPKQEDVMAFLVAARDCGSPTVGLHLDLWRGLAREKDIPARAFFRCDYVFSPDGGDPAFWAGYRVNHRFSPPAVLEASCYLAQPVPALVQDVIFVGSRGYHKEYPFRAELLAWLAATYGSRFTLYEHASGMRGAKLNHLYASARVVVGDSCFAGQVPGYTSDRLYETLGRGGRLVYPAIPGITDGAPCRTFEPGNLGALREQIEAALAVTDPAAVQAEREAAVAWTKAGHTYRHRLEAIFAQLRADGVLREAA